jgi:hypothetical protein
LKSDDEDWWKNLKSDDEDWWKNLKTDSVEFMHLREK